MIEEEDMKSYLLLDDGIKLEGKLQACICPAIGEIVFNTGMTGYQEIVTDPSYYGQIVVLTYPMIGNYGINSNCVQSDKVQVKGLIVKNLNENDTAFLDFMTENQIPVLSGVDTRYLTKHIRDKGVMLAQIVVEEALDTKDYNGIIPVYEVTTPENYLRSHGQYRLAVMDFGIKEGILKQLSQLDVQMKVFSATASVEEILDYKPEGLFLSNGPGDPAVLREIIENIRILSAQIPTFGICLGHQLLGLAYGAKTEKLLYGHRGCNQPVKDIKKDRVFITSQNHGYGIKEKSLEATPLEMTHVNMNDTSVEGFAHKWLPIFSVQYHPEASPGPDDSHYLFKEFQEMMVVNHA